MKMKMFTIFDSKTEVYSKPFYCLTMGEALRTFTDAVNGEGSPFKAHPEDYTLFGIGDFDDATAEIKSVPPVSLGVALEFIEQDARFIHGLTSTEERRNG